MSNDINMINSIPEVEAVIAEEEAKKQNTFAELGKLYYLNRASDCDEEFKPLVDEISASAAVIAECEQRILALKGIGTCPRCGGYVKETSFFCTACGAPLKQQEEPPVVEPEPEPQQIICPSCNSVMKPGMFFCTACGTRLIQPAPADDVPQTKEYVPDPEPISEPEPMIEPEPIIEPVVEPEVIAEPVIEPIIEPIIEPVDKPAVEENPYSAPAPSVICPMCGKVSAPGMRFCISCGTRLTDEPAPAAQDFGVRRCQNCGHISANPTMPFCTECGTRLN